MKNVSANLIFHGDECLYILLFMVNTEVYMQRNRGFFSDVQ